MAYPEFDRTYLYYAKHFPSVTNAQGHIFPPERRKVGVQVLTCDTVVDTSPVICLDLERSTTTLGCSSVWLTNRARHPLGMLLLSVYVPRMIGSI